MNNVEVGADPWRSALTETTPEGIRVRGYDLIDLIGSVPFTSVAYLLYTGELPTRSAARLLDALMVASIDHGAGAPSVLAGRTVVSGGTSLQAGVAAGVLTMGQYHAAAVTDAMSAIREVVDLVDAGADRDRAAAEVVASRRREGARIGGFGHRQHTERDPRIDRLFSIAHDEGVGGSYIDAAAAIEAELESAVGRRLPMNIDAAYAAILAEIGFPPELGNAVFIASRVNGVIAHVAEELATMPPMRRIDPVSHVYDGPPSRQVPSGGFT